MLFLKLKLLPGVVYHKGFIKLYFLPDFFPDFLKTFSLFNVMVVLALLVANYVLQREFERYKLKANIADSIILATIFFGYLGAKVFGALEVYDKWQSLSDFFHLIFSFETEGLAWYGGLTFVLLYSIRIAKRNKIPFFYLLDRTAPALAIGYAIGRLGCFFSGDGCYGGLCNAPVPFCMNFSQGADTASWHKIQSLATHYNLEALAWNTPLMASLFSIALFFLLQSYRKNKFPIGTNFIAFIFIHSIYSFFIEFIRLNPANFLGLTQAQFFSIILIALCIAGFFYIWKKPVVFE